MSVQITDVIFDHMGMMAAQGPVQGQCTPGARQARILTQSFALTAVCGVLSARIKKTNCNLLHTRQVLAPTAWLIGLSGGDNCVDSGCLK